MTRLRIALWPRRSFSRSTRYVLKRLMRLDMSPHAVAAGVAAGMFAACTPFLGFHMIMAAALAWALSGSMVAAALATFFGNPLTYPAIWIGTLKIGQFLLGLEAGPAPHMAEIHGRFRDMFEPVILPMAIGSVPVGLVTALIGYFLVRRSFTAISASRKTRIAVRRHALEAQSAP